MKAWMVGILGADGAWLIHAPSAGLAKSLGRRYTDIRDYDVDYVDLWARRCPELDGLPLNLENAEKVLWFVESRDDPEADEYCVREDYKNGCPCIICTGGNNE